MKRLSARIGVLAAGALLLIPAAVLGSAPPRAQLRAFSCQRALDPANRTIAVTSVTRPLPGTRHEQVKFDLFMTRHTGGRSRAIHAGDLGLWLSPSNPTLGQLSGDVWNLQKSVVELAAPASYRFRVKFRWLGAGHAVLGTAVRFSRRCRQRELRPDLQVRSIAVSKIANQPDRNLYTAVTANRGNSRAGPFKLLFAPADGTGTVTHSVPVLRAHASRVDRFVGPVCSASTVPTVTADSADQVDDLNRANNALTASCPPAGG
ncbi:MAG: hypothetical protein M3016_09345 [Actinomycetota bacterium]|nr:hypothetical protein [Actinomycetota bacterium]